MKIPFIQLLSLLLAAAVLLSACTPLGSSASSAPTVFPTDVSTGPSAEPTPAPTAEPTAATTEPTCAPTESTEPPTEPPVLIPAECPTHYVSDAMMELVDPWGVSNCDALAAVMRKAHAGEKVTVAVIGGSITKGTISSGSLDYTVESQKCYADIFHDWWVTTFPEAEIEFINAGIGATNSYLGVHRIQKDVLDYQPDLVLIEYAVNDRHDETCRISYENLIRKILIDPNHPAVMLLFMGSTDYFTAQEQQSEIGIHYQLPMVSYINVLEAMLKDGVYEVSAMSTDVVHPSALGHRITGEILWKYLNGIYANAYAYGTPTLPDAPPLTEDRFTFDPKVLNRTGITPIEYGTFYDSNMLWPFQNSWSTNSGDGGLVFELSFRSLGIQYMCEPNGYGGQFEVWVDGEYMCTLDADFSGGWGYYAEDEQCYTSEEAATHIVEIRKAPDSTGSSFTVLGLYVSE